MTHPSKTEHHKTERERLLAIYEVDQRALVALRDRINSTPVDEPVKDHKALRGEGSAVLTRTMHFDGVVIHVQQIWEVPRDMVLQALTGAFQVVSRGG